MRMSNGASWEYEKPRSVSSICRLDSPRSMNTALTSRTRSLASTSSNASKAACTGVKRSASLSRRMRSVAKAKASVSRSMPMSRAFGAALRKLVAWPARPSVQSTTTDPGFSSAGATRSTH